MNDKVRALYAEAIAYQKYGEPDFVEGEIVQARTQLIAGDGTLKVVIPAQSPGEIIAEWREDVHGVEAHCFLLSVNFFGYGVVLISPSIVSDIVSIDPVWSIPPRMPRSLGKGSYHG